MTPLVSNLIAAVLFSLACFGVMVGPGYLGWLVVVALMFIEIPGSRCDCRPLPDEETE